MKKIIISVLLVTMSLSLAACGVKDKKASNGAQTQKSDEIQKGAFGDLKTVPQFKVKDINDKEVNNDIFKDKKLTMINIWGTFCGPCIEEMPILQELYKEYGAKGVNIVGVVSDGDANEVQALQILKKKNADFVNLIPDEKFKNEFVQKATAVPTSVLVNSKGEILETVVGSKSKEGYKKIIDNNLQQIK